MSITATPLPAMATTITIRVPMAIRPRGGRKLVVTPDGSPPWEPQQARVDSTLVKALARAHRWKSMLDDGRYATIGELAAGEKLDRGYLGKMLLLTLLAPDIIEAILDGRHHPNWGYMSCGAGFRPNGVRSGRALWVVGLPGFLHLKSTTQAGSRLGPLPPRSDCSQRARSRRTTNGD